MRLLVVDDEEGLAASLKRGLEAAGYAVDVAHDGHTGLYLAREDPYQAIVLDIMLPGLNGYRVCARLRAEGVDTPILMLTAKNGEYDEAEGLDTGADDYMERVQGLSEDLLLLARLDGTAPFPRDPVNLTDLVHDLVEEHRHLRRAHPLETGDPPRCS